MKISFIIVHYNVAGYLKNCLQSVIKYADGVDYEVLVIDNHSPDPSWKALMHEFPDVKFIKNTVNAGFAKANNLAVREAKGKFLFFLNPDTEIEGFYISEIVQFAENRKDFGCLGLRMHDAYGHFLPESKRSVPNAVRSFDKLFNPIKKNGRKSYYRDDIPEQAVAEVDILTGANLMVLKAVYEQVGGFDERYFMYGEDIDFCYTVLNAGFRNYYYGRYAILHHKGKSTTKDKAYLERFYGAMQIFLDKYYKHEKPLQHKFLSAGLRLKKRLESLKK